MDVLRAGQKIGEHVLDERVGQGAYGEVWRAHHAVLGERVAVKVCTDPEYAKNLRTEGIIQRTLNSPHIVRTLGVDPYHDPPYLVVEYVQGQSLRDVLRDGTPLAFQTALNYARQILEALVVAHAAGVIHRDLKPENVLIDETGTVKVTDFGLGYVQETTTASMLQSGSLVSRGGSIVGTVDYMAPEQRVGGTVDHRADIYAFGVVLFEMLTGIRPTGSDVPSDVSPDVPHWLDEVFKRCHCHVDRRYKSMSELRAAVAGPQPKQRERGQVASVPQSCMPPLAVLISPGPAVSAVAGPSQAGMRTERPTEAVLTLILGIVSACLWWIPGLGFLLSVASLWLATRYFRRHPDPASPGRGMTITGLVCGIIATALGLFFTAFLIF